MKTRYATYDVLESKKIPRPTFLCEEGNNKNKATKDPMGYMFLGERKPSLIWFGSEPMMSNWGVLNEPIPPFLYQASAKLSVG